MAAKFDHNDDSVVVIIGSGAGGATLANELAQKGISSVVLEAGKRLEISDFKNDDVAMFGLFTWLDPRTTSGSWSVAKTSPNLPIWICKLVGGTTVHWTGVSLRFQEHEFKTRTTYGDIKGANLLDWPISLKELEPYYEKAEHKMGVTGTNNLPHLPINNNGKVMYAGAKAIGYTKARQTPIAINSVPRDNRLSCQQTGFCSQGCTFGAKWSTLYTEIPKAEDTGKAEFRANCMVLQIEHDKRGHANGVVYMDPDGNMQRQKARIVCVAGNSIESPRLLLNSASSMFPDGLANSSGQVGKNYTRHTTGLVWGVFEKPVHMYRGTTISTFVQDEAGYKPERGFAGGYLMELISMNPPSLAGNIAPGHWGRDVASMMDDFPNMAGMWIIGEDMAIESNRITLNTDVKDQYGLPVANIHADDHPNDNAMRAHGFQQGEALYRAVGATRVIQSPPAPSTHNMGTNRMSAKPRDGVVNKHGQSHDVKNLFVSDGSQFTSASTENPTLTIVALAIRQADYIAEQMRKGAI